VTTQSNKVSKMSRYLLLGEIPQNTKRNKKRGFYESAPINIPPLLKYWVLFNTCWELQ
jgi:hypothetical protein